MDKAITITFDHFVEFTKDDCLFVSAHQDSGRKRCFLIYNKTGRVYTRNALRSSWDPMETIEAASFYDQAQRAKHAGHVPYFTTHQHIN